MLENKESGSEKKTTPKTVKEADKNKTEEKIDSYVGYFGVSGCQSSSSGGKLFASTQPIAQCSKAHTHTLEAVRNKNEKILKHRFLCET